MHVVGACREVVTTGRERRRRPLRRERGHRERERAVIRETRTRGVIIRKRDLGPCRGRQRTAHQMRCRGKVLIDRVGLFHAKQTLRCRRACFREKITETNPRKGKKEANLVRRKGRRLRKEWAEGAGVMERWEVGRRDEDYVEQGMSDAAGALEGEREAGKKQGKRGMGREVWGGRRRG